MEQRKLAIFKWSLEWPFGMLPLKPGEFLSSPTFYAEDSRTTEFCLKIDRGDNVSCEDNTVAGIFLCRCDKNAPDNVEVEFELCVKPNDTVGTFIYNFGLQSGNLYKIGQNGLKINRSIKINEWIIVCRILSYNDGESINSKYPDRDDLKSLSLDFTKMLENSWFSDFIIQRRRKAFNVHKAILKVRCPALLEEEQVTILLGRYSQTTIQMILRYLYSGKFNSDDVPDELYNLLQSDYLHLRHLIEPFPVHTYSKTHFAEKSFCFTWAIRNVLNQPQDHKCTCVITEDYIFPWFKFSFFLYQRKGDQNVSEFVVERLRGETNVFVRLKLSVKFKRKDLKKSVPNYYHYFHNEDIWEVSMDWVLNSIRKLPESSSEDEVLNLHVKFQISDGERTTSTKHCKNQSSSKSFHLRALHGLGQDMKKLVDNPLDSDVNLIVGDKTFPVHKAILSARSPVFREMFQQKELKKKPNYVIKDLEENVVSAMISYIYSGQINDIDVHVAVKLYKAAERYKVLELRKKCAKFIKSSLNATNINRIKSFAKEYCDLDLQEYLRDFKT